MQKSQKGRRVPQPYSEWCVTCSPSNLTYFRDTAKDSDGIDVYMFRSIEKKQSKYNHIEFKESWKLQIAEKKLIRLRVFFRT